MRVPTYSNYLNMANAISNNKSLVDKYSYQSLTGLKHQTYSGYGMSAYNIVSMESTLKLTNTFMENNNLADIELKTSNLAIETITDLMADFKVALSDFYGTDLTRVSPDYTGGELTFTSDDINTYVGKTLTVNGTTYTFATNADNANNINIADCQNATDIMNAVVAKVDNKDFKLFDGKLSFPEYTIDGVSTLLTEEPAKSAVKTGEVYTMNADQSLALNNLQNLAFSTMQMVSDTLNTFVNGKYIYGGGASNAPISFDFSSLEEFQSYYDGINTVFPNSASAVLSNFSVDATNTGDVEFSVKAGSTNEGIITANGGSFLKESMVMNSANVGTVAFDNQNNTMKATVYGAFNTLKSGDTIVLGGNELGANAKAYTIKSVSSDGRTVTFEDSTPVETAIDAFDPDGKVVINSTFAVGSVISLDGFDNKNLAPTATVTGISDDGKQLFVKVDTDRFDATSTGNTKWSISAQSYYNGGDLEYNQRISESQTISFDVKASDPAFEKIFRALGQIAQGNLVDTSNPAETGKANIEKTLKLVEEAMALVNSATSGTGDVSNAKNSSLYSISAKINADYTVLNKVINYQTQTIANLENSIGSVKEADKNEAAVKLLMAEGALEASYSILSKVSSLSLLNYMK